MPKIVAEIGCNHKGDLATAKEMITTAAMFCKADLVKFQKRNNRELLSPAQYAAPHPNPAQSYGETYGAHREALEFDVSLHRELQAFCADLSIGYSSSVWDLTSAKEICALKPELIKIPSASNLNLEMLNYLAEAYEGEVHISLGMTTWAEEDEIAAALDNRGRLRDVVFYACTSAYPVSFDNICLGEITRLLEKFGGRTKAIGFSGHHLGIAADVAALALGATWFERHFTLDRTWKGTDHAASLEPDGLRRLCRDLHAVDRSLSRKPKELLECELPQRNKMKWGLAALD